MAFMAIQIAQHLDLLECLWHFHAVHIDHMLLIENITYVYISKAKNTQPDKPSAPPSQAHCQSFTCTPSLGLNTGPFCGPKDPEGVYTSEWPSPCTQPLPRYGLKQAKKVGTPSSCVRIILRVCPKVRHTLSSCVRTMDQLVQALPTPQTPTVLLTDVSKPAGTSLEDSTSAMGPYRRQYKSTLYSFFPWLPNWGTSWRCPNTQKKRYYKRFGHVIDTNRSRLCLLASNTGGKCVEQEPIFLSEHHSSICQKLREGIPRCGYCGRL
jgi:hypothetical protein